MSSHIQFLLIHLKNQSDGQRLGQRFVNAFFKTPWPELFYETDYSKASKMIYEWLEDNHYFEHLPPAINPIVLGEIS